MQPMIRPDDDPARLVVRGVPELELVDELSSVAEILIDQNCLTDRVGDVHAAAQIDRDVRWEVEDAPAECERRGSITVEHLDQTVPRVADIHPAIHANINAARQIENGRAERLQVIATGIKLLNAVVPRVSHVHVPGRINRDSPWLVELTVRRAEAAETLHVSACMVEDLDAVVVRIGNDDAPVRIHRHAVRVSNSPSAVPKLPMLPT